jgi:hypothetical protein
MSPSIWSVATFDANCVVFGSALFDYTVAKRIGNFRHR